MREIHDMKTSLSATVTVYGGALAVAFGVGMLISTPGSTAVWAGLALAGVVAIAIGALQRRPAQRAAYRLYLQAQDDRDLTQAKKDSLDEESMSLVKEELKRRKLA